ncbi:MAG: nuclear transport factor 2 family protein [Longimicrobiales bacterium]
MRGFHAALVTGDSLRALEHLHPDVIIYEGGHAETLAEYRSGHLNSDIAFAGAVRREIAVDAVTLWTDAALYTAESRATGHWRGRDIDSHGAESIILVETAGGWLIRHIHWSSR